MQQPVSRTGRRRFARHQINTLDVHRLREARDARCSREGSQRFSGRSIGDPRDRQMWTKWAAVRLETQSGAGFLDIVVEQLEARMRLNPQPDDTRTTEIRECADSPEREWCVAVSGDGPVDRSTER